MTYSIFGILILVLDIIALVEVLGGSGDTKHKVIWTAMILLLPIVGMVLYFLFGKRALPI